jgi:hypothetical protein
MASWGNTDDAANSVFYAPNQFNKTANTTNQTNLFGNTTADAFVTGAKVGQFGVKPDEMQAARAGANTKMAHAGWNLRVEGTGGRAGRVSYETLVAMSSISNDASDDAVLPDYKLSITTQPANDTANTSVGENATFTVVAASAPTGATFTYAWSYANGTAIATNANVGNTTQATLTVNSAVQTTNAAFKVAVSATGAATVTSSNATLTITT